MVANEFVVIKIRVRCIDTRDFFVLARAKRFLWVKAPNSFEQALTAQNLVESGDAAGKFICGVKKGSVRIGDLPTFLNQFGRDWRAGENRAAFFLELNGVLRPDRPVAEEAADDAAFNGPAVDVKFEWSEQVHDDVVVVAGIERDVAAGLRNGAHDFKSLITIEGRDFDSGDVFDFRKFAPELIREDAAPDGGLKVEADDGKNLRDGAAVREENGIARFFHRGKTEEAGVVAQVRKETCFLQGLRRFTTNSANTNQGFGAMAVGAIHFFCGEFQHGLEETNLRIANGELRGVNSDGKTAAARGNVIASEGALAAFVEFATRI